jgi:hypothetical protein
LGEEIGLHELLVEELPGLEVQGMEEELLGPELERLGEEIVLQVHLRRTSFSTSTLGRRSASTNIWARSFLGRRWSCWCWSPEVRMAEGGCGRRRAIEEGDEI